jgi:serine/threonine protein phosphatase 1
MIFTYVVPDIHGRDDLLCDGFKSIFSHASGHAGTIVMLGDYVSKGPDSRKVIDRLRKLRLPEGWLFFPLKGNHDAMMVEAFRNPAKIASWLDSGGDVTIASYGGNLSNVPVSDIEWLDKLPRIHIDRCRIYVHAGLDPEVTLDRQIDKTLLWKRYPDEFQAGFGEHHVVHGHDSFLNGPKLYEGRTNLDTRSWRSGRLVIGVFEDQTPGGPIDFIEVLGEPSRRN